MIARMSTAFVVAVLGASIFRTFEPPASPPPVVQFVGHDSKIATQRSLLIKDQQSWAKLWSEHSGKDETPVPPNRHVAPKIDFSRFMAVAYFAGTSTNVDGAPAVQVLQRDESVAIRFERSTFQTESFGDGARDRGVKTTPFGIWVIDRSGKPVVIEEGRRGLKADPVTWTEVARLESK